MGQPITTNPLVISLINMTVVFAVLFGLSLIVRLIRVIDPTQKKKQSPAVISRPQASMAETAEPAVAAEPDYDELMIVFTAALAAYGQSGLRIVSVTPAGGSAWSQTARQEAVSVRSRMF